jgi:GT2 family glycosyltransferase
MDAHAPGADPLVSFVIPVLNDAGNLARCLRAIQAQAGALPIEIIVVDNGSTDGSAQLARMRGAAVLQIPGVRVSALRNEGMRAARAPWVALIDADNEIAPGWLATAAAVVGRPAEAMAAIGRDYSSAVPGTWVQRLYNAFRRHPTAVQPVRWLATGNLVVNRAVALQIGGFDETLETCEDVDFCNRLRRRGHEIWTHPGLESIHHGDPATLTRLFVGELWRGRDALRVDLRGITAWADIPSMVIPLVALALMITGGVSALVAWVIAGEWLWWTLASAAGVVALSALKATRMFMRQGDRRVRTLAGLCLVALVYDTARALALVSRMPHRHANKSPRPTGRAAASAVHL